MARKAGFLCYHPECQEEPKFFKRWKNHNNEKHKDRPDFVDLSKVKTEHRLQDRQKVQHAFWVSEVTADVQGVPRTDLVKKEKLDLHELHALEQSQSKVRRKRKVISRFVASSLVTAWSRYAVLPYPDTYPFA